MDEFDLTDAQRKVVERVRESYRGGKWKVVVQVQDDGVVWVVATAGPRAMRSYQVQPNGDIKTGPMA